MEDKNKLDDDPENGICGSSTGDTSRSCTDAGNVSPTLTTSMSGVNGSSAANGEKETRVTKAGRSNAPTGKGDEEKKEEKEEEDDKCAATVHHESRAPDGGWGWMVALGAFVINVSNNNNNNSNNNNNWLMVIRAAVRLKI